MGNRKVPAEVPAATVPAEVPSAAVPEIVPPAAIETPQPVTPAPSAAGTPVTAATLMKEAAKPDLFQDLRDMIKKRQRAGKRLVEGMDEAQLQEYREALANDSNIMWNNRTTMADRVTRFMKKNGIEPTDSGIVKALEQSAEDIAVSPTTGLKRPSFNAADHEVLFDMIKDRMETPTAGVKPVAAAPAITKPAAIPEVPKAAAKPKLDHGQLNLPLEKRGGGSIDSQLDRYKANQAKAEKAAAKEAAGIRRSDKAIARDLFTQHAQALAESTAAKRGIPVSDSIKLMDSMAKWEPKKLIKLLEKYQADNSKPITVGELMEKAKSKELTIEAEAELVAPKIIDAPRSLSKVYGSNWMERGDAAQLKSGFNKATRERTKSLEAYKKYVEESNRRFDASKEYNSQKR